MLQAGSNSRRWARSPAAPARGGAPPAPAPRRARARRAAAERGPQARAVSHYEVLGVPPDAPLEEIKARYRKLAKQTHPDASGGEEQLFLAVRRAYEHLSNELLRAEHDQQLGINNARGGDPRFARFNRWRSEVVPELRAQLQIWTAEMAEIARSEAAAWRALVARALEAAAAAEAAVDAWAAAGGAAAAAAAVAGAGIARFAEAAEGDESGSSGDDGADLDDWGAGNRGSSSSGGGGGGSEWEQERRVQHRARHRRRREAAARSEAERSAEAARAALGELGTALSEAQAAVGWGQACAQRQYDKRIEQVAARYRAYGEVVWFDVFEEEAAPWLSEATAALERQRGELAGLEARAAAVLAAAEGGALI
ncbi:hypothetical protein Rsub_12434 [Raphidocelis subcapitata]|uniref:J domain-containing protein n=1 Tax=Raphidocelis subcapitata TaxID=307507 RepID=A0A2V0PIU1_9CHLO|nr:hypothetical protein Rsub_12434 [Raphidocelis subcapitata]|eukprot:GBF99721.1 hypothetical protein Rsub_12434 [Raphidocelis subcapitata]